MRRQIRYAGALAVGIVAALVSAVGCDTTGSPPAEANLDAATAEKLLMEWASRLGVGNTNCRMELPKGDGSTDGLSLEDTRATLRGATAERCFKALAASQLVTSVSCGGALGDNTCAADLNPREVSAACEPEGLCRLIFICGSATLGDTSITTEGKRATIEARVVNRVSQSAWDGCPAASKVSEDGAWVVSLTRLKAIQGTAKAT